MPGLEGWILHPVLDESSTKRLTRTCNDIIRETKEARSRPDFPPEAIAIGDLGTGDVLLLLPDPDDPSRLQDAVYWWDHETGGVERVADDFSELPKD